MPTMLRGVLVSRAIRDIGFAKHPFEFIKSNHKCLDLLHGNEFSIRYMTTELTKSPQSALHSIPTRPAVLVQRFVRQHVAFRCPDGIGHLPVQTALIEYLDSVTSASPHMGEGIVSQSTENVADQARQIYEERLRMTLEESHMNEFVAIEPVSGEYFLGRTLSDAIGASREKYPDRLAHAFRVGHRAAIHFGFQIR